jgi:hypothetical protein
MKNEEVVNRSYWEYTAVSIPLRGIGYEKLQARLQNVAYENGEAEFPSPCGELVMKNRGAGYLLNQTRGHVSIPLRGIGYEKLKCFWGAAVQARLYHVSIPLRGIGYEKQPEPCKESLTSLIKRFHPLAGNWL